MNLHELTFPIQDVPKKQTLQELSQKPRPADNLRKYEKKQIQKNKDVLKNNKTMDIT